MLAVGREHEVLGPERAAGADLGRFLAEQLGPDPELAVTLQRRRLGVDAPGEDHVAVEPADLLFAEVTVELGVVDAFALRCQELDQLRAAVLLRGSEHLTEAGAEVGRLSWVNVGHARSFVSPSRGVAAGRVADPTRP